MVSVEIILVISKNGMQMPLAYLTFIAMIHFMAFVFDASNQLSDLGNVLYIRGLNPSLFFQREILWTEAITAWKRLRICWP